MNSLPRLKLVEALQVGTFIIACQDLVLGLSGMIAICVVWSENETAFLGRKCIPVEPGPRRGFVTLDDSNNVALSLLVFLVGWTFAFGVILLCGVYRRSKTLLEIWKILNHVIWGSAMLVMLCLALTKYSTIALIGSIIIAFRIIELWIVMAFQKTADLMRLWEFEQEKENSYIEIGAAIPALIGHLGNGKPASKIPEMAGVQQDQTSTTSVAEVDSNCQSS